jgi:hypothetical protein
MEQFTKKLPEASALPAKKRGPGRPRKHKRVTEEIEGLVTPRLLEYIKNTRVAVYRGGLTPHQGKFEVGKKAYLNRIIYLTELDLDKDGNVTERSLKLNVNSNNKMSQRLPDLVPGDILVGFNTCDDFYEDGSKDTIYPGKMLVLKGKPRLEQEKLAGKKPEARESVPLSAAMRKIAVGLRAKGKKSR